jgi:hypothetical protein
MVRAKGDDQIKRHDQPDWNATEESESAKQNQEEKEERQEIGG